jgi:hypothetical protein
VVGSVGRERRSALLIVSVQLAISVDGTGQCRVIHSGVNVKAFRWLAAAPVATGGGMVVRVKFMCLYLRTATSSQSCGCSLHLGNISTRRLSKRKHQEKLI